MSEARVASESDRSVVSSSPTRLRLAGRGPERADDFARVGDLRRVDGGGADLGVRDAGAGEAATQGRRIAIKPRAIT